MKVLWVVNSFVGELARQHGYKISSGQWLNAEIEKEKEAKQNEILVCTSGNVAEEIQDQNIRYVVLQHGPISKYQDTQQNRSEWQSLLDEETPDIIIIWGTEYLIGKCVLNANVNKISTLVYIQGVMSSIYQCYRGGLTDEETQNMTTLLERLRKTDIFSCEKRYENLVRLEREAICLADGVIVENEWAESEYLSINPNIKIFKNRLPLNTVFSKYVWEEEKHNKRVILTTASGYPLKGLHNTLKMLAKLKEKYPDVLLLIPGNNSFFVKGFKANLRQSGYCRYIKNVILKNDLINNVRFVGTLSADEYAQAMQESEIFLSSSAIENHGSALREAMTVGIPCVASAVGGIPEYAFDHKNCSLYEYGNIGQMLQQVEELFENKELRVQYSVNGKANIQRMYEVDKLLSLNEIYGLALRKGQ